MISFYPSVMTAGKLKRPIATDCWVQWLIPVIPPTQEVVIGRINVQGQPGGIVSKSLFQPNRPGVVVCACDPSYMGGANRIAVQAGLNKKM
jgi:hypothetical protein